MLKHCPHPEALPLLTCSALLLSIGKNALPHYLDHYTRTPQSTVVSWEAFGAEGFGAGSKAMGAGGGVASTAEKAKKTTTNDSSALKAARIPEKGRDSPMESKMGGAADAHLAAKGESAGAEEGEMAVPGDLEMKDAAALGLDEGEIPGAFFLLLKSLCPIITIHASVTLAPCQTFADPYFMGWGCRGFA